MLSDLKTTASQAYVYATNIEAAGSVQQFISNVNALMDAAEASPEVDNTTAWKKLEATVTATPPGADKSAPDLANLSLYALLNNSSNSMHTAILNDLAGMYPGQPSSHATLDQNMSSWVATGYSASGSSFNTSVGTLYKGFLDDVAAFEGNNLNSSYAGTLSKNDKLAATRLDAFCESLNSIKQSVLDHAYLAQLDDIVKTAQHDGTKKLNSTTDGELNTSNVSLGVTTVENSLQTWIDNGAKADPLSTQPVQMSIQKLQNDLNTFVAADYSGLTSLLKKDSTLGGFLAKGVLSSTWLKSLSLWADPKNQANIGSGLDGNPLFPKLSSNDQKMASDALSDLTDKLVNILGSDESARYDLVQDYLNQLYQINLQLYQEQERHYKVIAQVAQLETSRWTTLQQINQNVSVTFDSLIGPPNRSNGPATQPAIRAGAETPAATPTGGTDSFGPLPERKGPFYFHFEGAKPQDYWAATQPIAKEEKFEADVSAATRSFTPPPVAPKSPGVGQNAENSQVASVNPKDLRQAQVDRLGAQAINSDPLAVYPAWPPKNPPSIKNFNSGELVLTTTDQIFASLRMLALYGESQFVIDTKNINPTKALQANALATDQRLKDLIKLLNNSLLMNAINLKFSLDDGRRLKQELMEHDLQLTELESAVKEANIQYRLNDLKIYHSGGITKEDLTALSQDAAVIFVATKSYGGVSQNAK